MLDHWRNVIIRDINILCLLLDKVEQLQYLCSPTDRLPSCLSSEVEWIPTKTRTVVGTLTSFFFTFGQMILAGLAYWLRDWRKLQLVVCAPQFLFFTYSWSVKPWYSGFLGFMGVRDQRCPPTANICKYSRPRLKMLLATSLNSSYTKYTFAPGMESRQILPTPERGKIGRVGNEEGGESTVPSYDCPVIGQVVECLGCDLSGEWMSVMWLVRWYVESARWLVLNRRSEEALKGLHRVARINRRPEVINKLTLEVTSDYMYSCILTNEDLTLAPRYYRYFTLTWVKRLSRAVHRLQPSIWWRPEG